jgi:hypothetical protein
MQLRRYGTDQRLPRTLPGPGIPPATGQFYRPAYYSNRPTLIPGNLSRGLFRFSPAIFVGPQWSSPAFMPAAGRLGAFGTGRCSNSTGQVQSHCPFVASTGTDCVLWTVGFPSLKDCEPSFCRLRLNKFSGNTGYSQLVHQVLYVYIYIIYYNIYICYSLIGMMSRLQS